jgi:glycosyltransferase involved in cell wall biosynthesis
LARPRILFLCSTLAVGGAERQLGLLVPRLREAGFEPMVAVLRHRGRFFDDLDAAGLPATFVGMRSRSDLRGAFRAYRLWKARPDIIYTRSIDAQLIGHAVAVRAGAPHVTEEQGGLGIHRKRHHVLAARLFAPRVERVVAVSESQLPDLVKLGYRRSAVRVIPNAVALPQPAREPADVRRELGVAPDDVLALLVSVLRPEKRADVFVEAIARARERDPRIRGVVAGGGPRLDAIRAQASPAGDGVLVLGERSDVPELMGAADVVCLSSDVEGVPMTVLEAMAVGRPVIATDVGGVRDAVVAGQTGVLVPPRDPAAFARALVALAGDPDRARRMAAEGRRRYLEHFTIEERVREYSAMLGELVGHPRSSDEA